MDSFSELLALTVVPRLWPKKSQPRSPFLRNYLVMTSCFRCSVGLLAGNNEQRNDRQWKDGN